MFRAITLIACGCLFALLPLQAQFRVYRPNPFAHQYFLGPTGFAQKPNKRHAQLFEGLLLQIQHVQPNGRTVVWGAIPPLMLGGNSPVWWMLQNRYPKYKSRGPILNWGCKAIGFRVSEQKAGALAMPYASLTLGTPDHHLTLGGGFGLSVVPNLSDEGPNNFWGKTPVATLHGMVRLGRRSCLLTENYLFPVGRNWAAISFSGYRRWGKRLALDLGCAIVPFPAEWSDEDKRLLIPLPWISLHFKRRDRNLAELGLE
jgi:hypothetical protein